MATNEWDNEPDREVWVSEAGLPAVVQRHPSLKHLCGYVAVPAGHPMYGKDYDAVPFEDGGYPHGGLTYASDHAPKEAPDGQFWFGFDCAHAGDLSPGLGHPVPGDVYRTFAYVKAEVEALAKHLASLAATTVA